MTRCGMLARVRCYVCYNKSLQRERDEALGGLRLIREQIRSARNALE